MPTHEAGDEMSSTPPVGTTKTFHTGTHRVRRPEQTWQIIEPRLDRFGITRVADVTGLDIFGIPVIIAVRPLAKTLAVSMGKGHTTTLAAVSAVMEGIEMWHAENAMPAATHVHCPAHDLTLPYHLDEILAVPGGLVTARTPLDWVDAIGMATGETVPLPVELVGFTATDERSWQPTGLRSGSNGLASGNSRTEAALHALYEVIERDAISHPDLDALCTDVDPKSITDSTCSELVDRLYAAGATLRLFHVANRFGVPCFGAELWTEDFPINALGWGAHLAPDVAAGRALTEAAQSRLGSIAGSRDDLAPVYGQIQQGPAKPPPLPEQTSAWVEVADGPGNQFTDIADELAAICTTVTKVTGAEPLLVDLSTDTDFAVVRVVVPGTVLDVDRIHPNGQAAEPNAVRPR
jgi:ribosomal protein S12 methylthiotransferase accessory factor